MFRCVLIANRGAIAARVMRTCRRLGVRTIAVYAPQEAAAPYVQMADIAVPLHGDSPRACFLDGAQLIAIAQAHGADAVHPGYGFLSENSAFARDCTDAGLTFIGPTADAMEQLGNKLRAKHLLQTAQVPMVPGLDGTGLDAAKIRTAADAIGYPVLIKAAAGGGGKGMRVVASGAELDAAIAAAQREAASAFGDPQVFLEKYVPNARHIEIQIAADQHGHVVHCGERDCTVQRRHQKIIEEAPSAVVSPALRATMGAVAVRIAEAAQYTNVGTVEFLLAPDQQFYFLEVNTRLQVEHGVTEAVYGIDLVEWQLRIAAGEPLNVAQADLQPRGHALQCRLYAEDPANGFVPATGQISALQWPALPALRIESSIAAGMTISVDFDPMLAKLIVYANDRAAAIAQMLRVLTQLHVRGVQTNQQFLAAVLRSQDFITANISTKWVEQFVTQWQQYAIAPHDPCTPWHSAETASTMQSAGMGSAAVAPIARRRPRKAAPTGQLNAPMPGRILHVHTTAGSAVDEGTVLVVMEAMKMEYQITAPAAGVVKHVACAVGQLVERGAQLITMETPA